MEWPSGWPWVRRGLRGGIIPRWPEKYTLDWGNGGNGEKLDSSIGRDATMTPLRRDQVPARVPGNMGAGRDALHVTGIEYCHTADFGSCKTKMVRRTPRSVSPPSLRRVPWPSEEPLSCAHRPALLE